MQNIYYSTWYRPFLKVVQMMMMMSFSDGVHDRLREYVLKHFPEKVVLLRTPQREGIMRARTFGAKEATGDVCVLLNMLDLRSFYSCLYFVGFCLLDTGVFG